MSASFPKISNYDSGFALPDSRTPRLERQIVADAEIRSDLTIFQAQFEQVGDVQIGVEVLKSVGNESTDHEMKASNKGPLPQEVIRVRGSSSKSVLKTVHFADQVKKQKESILTEIPGPSRQSSYSKSQSIKTSQTTLVHIPCQYESCGCYELVPKGTIQEHEHYQNCNFRPIPCILENYCNEIVPYHDFLFHMVTHYVQPKYGLDLTTKIFLWAEDFRHDQKWYPKWISAQSNHFFLMIQRKTPGIWMAWIWMLGSKEEANAYRSTIIFFKGLRSVSGSFSVHSIRETSEEIEIAKDCLLLTDQAMLNLSQIGENVLTDFTISVQVALKSTITEGQSEVKTLMSSQSSAGKSVSQSPVSSEARRNSRGAVSNSTNTTTQGLNTGSLIDSRSDFGLEVEDSHDSSSIMGVTFDDVLKLFTSNNPIRGYDSSISTTAERNPDLDQDFTPSLQRE